MMESPREERGSGVDDDDAVFALVVVVLWGVGMICWKLRLVIFLC